MTTASAIREAHDHAPKHRFALRDLIRVDEALATPEDLKLIDTFRKARSPIEFDIAVHSLAINRLFLRGVIYIGEKR